MRDPIHETLREIVDALTNHAHLTVRNTALRLNCSPKFVRKHLMEFPNAWRLSGGDIRIPVNDIEAYITKNRIFKLTKKVVV
jgi:hypothetical protein